MQQKRTLRFLSFALFIALSFSNGIKAEDGKLKVGFVGALSGPGKPYGVACQNGIELAKDPSTLDVVYEDDQFDPKKSVLAFKKLVDIDKVDLIVTLGSSPAQAIAPLAQTAKIPLIAWASDERVSAGRSFVIRTWPKGSDEGKAIAAEAKKRSIKNPAVIVATDDYSQSILRGMVAEFGENSIRVKNEVEPTLQDFRSLLPKLKSGSIDGIATCVSVGQISTLARQVRGLGITLPLFGCISLDDPNEWKLAQGALANSWYVTGGVDPEFRIRYREKYGNEDLITGAAVHYDVAKLIGEIAAKKVVRKEELLDAILTSGKRKGAVGDFQVVSTPEDRYFDVPLIVKTVPKE